ncbi:5404_t:CDS:10, partial [Entrophospora sp. SA101]
KKWKADLDSKEDSSIKKSFLDSDKLLRTHDNQIIENKTPNSRSFYNKSLEFKNLPDHSSCKPPRTRIIRSGKPKTFESILNVISKECSLSSDAEITMEANPTSAETNNLREFKSIGITRLSLGVQSLNDNDLLKLGRDHNSKDAIKSLEIAKKIFKNNVSFDLIFGRNNQNVSNWIKELKLALELADNHLSIYELTIKPGTPIYKEYKLGKLKIPSSDKITDMYESTIQIAKEFGFKQYEVSNFYKNSKYSRHNFGYWNGLDYLGIGPGAHGRLYDMKNNKRLRTFRILYPEDWMRQCEDLGHGMRKSVEMDLKTIKEELIVFGLRTKLGIPKKRFNLHSDGEQLEDFINVLQVSQLVKDGFLIFDDYNDLINNSLEFFQESINGSLRPTKNGLRLIDEILPRILY